MDEIIEIFKGMRQDDREVTLACLAIILLSDRKELDHSIITDDVRIIIELPNGYFERISDGN